MSLITDQSTSTATTASLLETILSQEEYDRTDVFPAKDMNLGSHFLCASCTYCRCCPLASPPAGWFTNEGGILGATAQPCFCGQRAHQVCICCEADIKCHLKYPKMEELCVNEQVSGCGEQQCHLMPTTDHPLMIGICGYILWTAE
eukprot:gene7029-10326_t